MERKNERRSFLKHFATLSAFIAGSILSFKNRSFNIGKIGQTEAYGMGTSGNAADSALEARVRVLEDREKIKELMHTYKNSFMNGEFDKIISLFANEATDGFTPTVDIKPDGTAVGRGFAEVKRQFTAMKTAHFANAEVCWMYHYNFDVTGNTAKGTWWVSDYMQRIREGQTDQGSQTTSGVHGIYTVEFAKIDGTWKFILFQHRHRPIKAVAATGPPDI